MTYLSTLNLIKENLIGPSVVCKNQQRYIYLGKRYRLTGFSGEIIKHAWLGTLRIYRKINFQFHLILAKE